MLSREASAQLGGRMGVEGPGLSRWQRGLYGAGSVFLRYAWARADQVGQRFLSIQVVTCVRFSVALPSRRHEGTALARCGSKLCRLEAG